jgi:hypothetical protein
VFCLNWSDLRRLNFRSKCISLGPLDCPRDSSLNHYNRNPWGFEFDALGLNLGISFQQRWRYYFLCADLPVDFHWRNRLECGKCQFYRPHGRCQMYLQWIQSIKLGFNQFRSCLENNLKVGIYIPSWACISVIWALSSLGPKSHLISYCTF